MRLLAVTQGMVRFARDIDLHFLQSLELPPRALTPPPPPLAAGQGPHPEGRWGTGAGESFEKGILGSLAAQNTLNLDSSSPQGGEEGKGMGQYAQKRVTL